MNPIYDPQTSPRNHAGLLALLELLANTATPPTRSQAITTITNTGLTIKSATHILRRSGRRQATLVIGKNRPPHDRRHVIRGPNFDAALAEARDLR